MQSTESPKVELFSDSVKVELMSWCLLFWLSLGLLLRILAIVNCLSFPIYDHSRKHNSLFHMNQFYEIWYLLIICPLVTFLHWNLKIIHLKVNSPCIIFCIYNSNEWINPWCSLLMFNIYMVPVFVSKGILSCLPRFINLRPHF